MGLAGLHAFSRNAPYLGGQVEFVKLGAYRLVRAHRRQNGEFEGERGDTFLGSQPNHESRDVLVGQGGVMLDAGGSVQEARYADAGMGRILRAAERSKKTARGLDDAGACRHGG